jgi:putative heme-binding domain-containing protein
VSKFAVWIFAGGILFAEAQGDPSRGKAIFEGKGDCLSCHRVKVTGSRSGPELTSIGKERRATPAYLERALLDPDADVKMANRGVRVTLKRDGTVVTGSLLNRDMFTVELVDGQGNTKLFPKSELSKVTIVNKGLMPSYKGKLNADEIKDLVSYLRTLK